MTNNKKVTIDDLKLLKNGNGLPFLISLEPNVWVQGYVSMKKFGYVKIKYVNNSRTEHIYQRTTDDTRNGFDKFKADIELFKSSKLFHWINNDETQMTLLELMPDFHKDMLKRNKKALSEFLHFNNTVLNLDIPEKYLSQIQELNDLFKG